MPFLLQAKARKEIYDEKVDSVFGGIGVDVRRSELNFGRTCLCIE